MLPKRRRNCSRLYRQHTARSPCQSELQQSGCSAGGRPRVEASSRHDVAEPDRRQRHEAEVRADQDVPLGLPESEQATRSYWETVQVRQVSVLR